METAFLKTMIVASGNNAFSRSGGRRSLSSLLGDLAHVHRRIQTSPASFCSAQTRSVLLAIEKAIVVSQLFSHRNIAQSNNPHLAPDLIRFAIWLATMIDETGHSIAVDNFLAAVEPKQIGVLKIVVKVVGLFIAHRLAHIFNDQCPLANRPRSVTTERVDARLANDQRHRQVTILSAAAF